MLEPDQTPDPINPEKEPDQPSEPNPTDPVPGEPDPYPVVDPAPGEPGPPISPPEPIPEYPPDVTYRLTAQRNLSTATSETTDIAIQRITPWSSAQ